MPPLGGNARTTPEPERRAEEWKEEENDVAELIAVALPKLETMP